MHIAAIKARLVEAGAKPGHIERLFRNWLNGRPLEECEPARMPPAAVLRLLPLLTCELDTVARVSGQHASEDGSIRQLLELSDGQSVESVLLGRDGLCVSSQVGCAVGCRFCMTGRGGLQRQLDSLEILAQVAVARRQRFVKKVVFMGMGEPAHNLENVMEAIEWLGTLGGIGHKNLVFSTVGDRRVFDRLLQGPVKPALALSLHTTRAVLRRELLPSAPQIDPAALVDLADAYCRATGYPIQYQWTLIEGVNDGDDELDALVRLLAGKYAVLNLIPFNEVDGSGFRRPTAERAEAMTQHLYRHGILAKLRQSAGQDIAGACGQLRARSDPRIRRG